MRHELTSGDSMSWLYMTGDLMVTCFSHMLLYGKEREARTIEKHVGIYDEMFKILEEIRVKHGWAPKFENFIEIAEPFLMDKNDRGAAARIISSAARTAREIHHRRMTQ